MMSRLVVATDIKNFYVWTKYGLHFFNERLEFGKEIDVSNLSPVTIQNLCDQRLIGSLEQVEQTAGKNRINSEPLIERKETLECNDTIELLNSNQSQKNENLRGKKK